MHTPERLSGSGHCTDVLARIGAMAKKDPLRSNIKEGQRGRKRVCAPSGRPNLLLSKQSTTAPTRHILYTRVYNETHPPGPDRTGRLWSFFPLFIFVNLFFFFVPARVHLLTLMTAVVALTLICRFCGLPVPFSFVVGSCQESSCCRAGRGRPSPG